LGIARAVFLPKQYQRYTAPLQLLMHLHPIDRIALGRRRAGKRKQQPLERRIVELLRHRPGDPDHPRAADILPYRRPADARCFADLPIAQSNCVLYRSTSRTLRIDNLSVGIANPLLVRGQRSRDSIVDGEPPQPLIHCCPPSSESCPRSFGIVSAIVRNPHLGFRCLTVRVSDREVRHLISTGYLSLESSQWAPMVAIAK
jgi:hypothetical protein